MKPCGEPLRVTPKYLAPDDAPQSPTCFAPAPQRSLPGDAGLFRWVVVQVLPEPSLDLCHANPFAFAVIGDLITVDLAEAEIS